MKTIIEKILRKMKVSAHSFRFLVQLFPILLCFQGKANFRNLARYSPFNERTFSRNFRKSFPHEIFNQHLLEELPYSSLPLLLALDPSFIRKSGDSTYGLDFYYNGAASRAEKGLEINLVAFLDLAADTAYALSARQTPPSEKSKTSTKNNHPDPNRETRMDFYLKHLLSCLPYVPRERFQRKYVVADGFFAKKKFVSGVKKAGIQVVSKLRNDADLWTLFSGEQKQRGRKRLYGEKVKFEHFEEWEYEGEIDVGVSLYSRVLFHKSLHRKIKVVAFEWEDRKGKRHYVLLFSTDLDQEAWEIYVFYKSRFQIEFLFRDANNWLGYRNVNREIRRRWTFILTRP